ncbi:MAG: hypothetical protein QXJ17_07935 [Nitrososphaeria archaeon]
MQKTKAQKFYEENSLNNFSRKDILEGNVVKINPALITITDGLVGKIEKEELQNRVRENALRLLKNKVRTFHVDINFEDYKGFGVRRPDVNDSIFTRMLNKEIRSLNGFLNLHLLTNSPLDKIHKYRDIGAGAICFQLDAIDNPSQLGEVVEYILKLGATASPVIETVGSESLRVKPVEETVKLLSPILYKIGMLTFQAVSTASRSDQSDVRFDKARVDKYVKKVKGRFKGTIQVQGGITSKTVGEAVSVGAEFLVVGTQIFRNREGLKPEQVVELLLKKYSETLAEV